MLDGRFMKSGWKRKMADAVMEGVVVVWAKTTNVCNIWLVLVVQEITWSHVWFWVAWFHVKSLCTNESLKSKMYLRVNNFKSVGECMDSNIKMKVMKNASVIQKENGFYLQIQMTFF